LMWQKLWTECFPQVYRTQDGFSQPSWGFRSLLGAMWLQMMFLVSATGKVRYCLGPGCNAVISFDQPQQPPAPGLKKNDRSRGYRTRRDKVFCSKRCNMAHRRQNERAKAGGPPPLC